MKLLESSTQRCEKWQLWWNSAFPLYHGCPRLQQQPKLATIYFFMAWLDDWQI